MRSVIAVLTVGIVLACCLSVSAQYDVYKDWPNPVPDVDKTNPGDNSCWVACASNLLGGGGWGTGATSQECAEGIYGQLMTDIYQGTGGFSEVAINYWLYNYGMNPDSADYQPGVMYTDVTSVYKPGGLDSNDYNFLLDELQRCQYVTVGFDDPAHCLTMVGGNYSVPGAGATSVWHDSDRDCDDGSDDSIYNTVFDTGAGFNLTPTDVDPNSYPLYNAQDYVTLCPGLRKPDKAVRNYDVAYFGVPDAAGSGFSPELRVRGEKAGVYGETFWEDEGVLVVGNEEILDMRKEIWLLVDYIDRDPNRVEDILLEDDNGTTHAPSDVTASEDGGQLLFHWVLDYQPAFEKIIFPSSDYQTLWDPESNPDVLVKDWNLATHCVPEPSTMLLLAIGGLMLAVAARRRGR